MRKQIHLCVSQITGLAVGYRIITRELLLLPETRESHNIQEPGVETPTYHRLCAHITQQVEHRMGM